MLELVPGGDGARHVRVDGIVPEQLNPGDEAPLAAGLDIARVDDKAMQPSVEVLVIAQVRQVSPRPEQGLLGRILRMMGIAQDAVGEGVAAVHMRLRQRFERASVA